MNKYEKEAIDLIKSYFNKESIFSNCCYYSIDLGIDTYAFVRTYKNDLDKRMYIKMIYDMELIKGTIVKRYDSKHWEIHDWSDCDWFRLDNKAGLEIFKKFFGKVLLNIKNFKTKLRINKINEDFQHDGE